jgi:hypothetical protein
MDEDGSEKGDGADGSGSANANDPDASSDPAISGDLVAEDTEPGLQEGTLIYCYTVDVEARGWMRDLFSFLAEAKGITAMEVVSYSYVEPEEVQPSITQDGILEYEEPEGGTIVIQLKLYVFVDGGVTGTADQE